MTKNLAPEEKNYAKVGETLTIKIVNVSPTFALYLLNFPHHQFPQVPLFTLLLRGTKRIIKVLQDLTDIYLECNLLTIIPTLKFRTMPRRLDIFKEKWDMLFKIIRTASDIL